MPVQPREKWASTSDKSAFVIPGYWNDTCSNLKNLAMTNILLRDAHSGAASRREEVYHFPPVENNRITSSRHLARSVYETMSTTFAHATSGSSENRRIFSSSWFHSPSQSSIS